MQSVRDPDRHTQRLDRRKYATAFAWLVPAAVAFLVLVACGPGTVPDEEALSGRRDVVAGASAIPEPLASDVAWEVLAGKNGNAVDAAVAAHFALAVTYPYAGNIGGGGFAVLHVPGEGEFALDYRETAPSGAHRDLFLDEKGEVVEGLSRYSHLAAGVPGSVDGMWRLHQRFGSLPWRELVQPAIALAGEGFVLDEWTADSFARTHDKHGKLPPELRGDIDFARVFHGEPGSLLVQPNLARTLERIAERGPAGFYAGETAGHIVAEMDGKGLITLEDLAGYRSVWREPLEMVFRGHRIVSMPPPSSGGVALAQLFGMIEHFDIPPFRSAGHLHLVAEIEKRVFADRAHYLGDPDHVPVPVTALTDPLYLERRVSDIRLDQKTDPASITPGTPVEESGDTTHFSIVDGDGMAISVTTTLNGAYGSGIIVDGAGFLLNNEMDDFSAKPGVPNQFGVTGGESNAVGPGRRMLSSMTPTIVFDLEGEPWLVLGSPGGPTIFTTVFQVVVHRIDYRMSLADAVAAPRFHHQWPPRPGEGDRIRVEQLGALEPDATAALERLGYELEEAERLGDVQAVEITADGPIAESDPRLRGKAWGRPVLQVPQESGQ